MSSENHMSGQLWLRHQIGYGMWRSLNDSGARRVNNFNDAINNNAIEGKMYLGWSHVQWSNTDRAVYLAQMYTSYEQEPISSFYTFLTLPQ